MSNPMLEMLRNAPASNPMQMLSEFRRFASTMTPQGAKAEVERLLQSGKMSQQQFEDLKKQAESLSKFLK